MKNIIVNEDQYLKYANKKIFNKKRNQKAYLINAFLSIYGMVKYKRKSSPILKSVKITSFANALTSIVLTQVVLLDTYAKEYDLSQINGYTGMFVSLVIIFLGLYMIINIKSNQDS